MRQTFEQRDEVLVRVDAVRFAGLHERIQVGGGVCAGDGITEEPVAAADSERSDRVLTRVMPPVELCRARTTQPTLCALGSSIDAA
jgi:hypothetical protein